MAVCGSTNQANIMFKGSGSQRTVNMLMVLTTAIVKPPDLWSTSTIGTILAEGDKLYSSLAEMKKQAVFADR